MPVNSFRQLVESRTPARAQLATRAQLAERVSGRSDPENDVDKPSATQYLHTSGQYRPMGPARLVERLPPGSYKLQSGMGGPTFLPSKAKTDDLIKFKYSDSVMNKVISEVDHFWGLKERFDKLGYLHRRGILMYGPPGSGKSCLIQQVCERMVGRGDLVFHAASIHSLQDCLGAMRAVESDRPVVVMLEDMDEYVGHQEQSTLQLLDGADAVNRVLYLGTTNYMERFPARLLRPGRFDRTVKIGYPPAGMRLEYLQHKLNGVEKPEVISHLAEQTDGFGLGHLRELVIAGYAFQEDLSTVLKRLRTHGTAGLSESCNKLPLKRRLVG